MAQAHTWKFIEKTHSSYFLANTIVIFTDSDNIMLDQALNNLAFKLHTNPHKIAYAGYMSCMSKSKNWFLPNLIKFMQDTEYVSNEINRFFELSMGTVNCLPGGFTAIRYSAFKQVAKMYYLEEEIHTDTITQFHQKILGEDRYLTHLLHLYFPKNSIGFCPLARCKTDPPDTIIKYIKQRRRWLLGAAANEAYMLSSPCLWKKIPLMLLYKIVQTAWRSTIFCQLIVTTAGLKSYLYPYNEDKPWVYPISISTPVVFAWIGAALAGFALRRYKVIFFWPFMIIGQTVLQIFVDFYALFTWRKKCWGGPRVQKQESNSNDTAQNVV